MCSSKRNIFGVQFCPCCVDGEGKGKQFVAGDRRPNNALCELRATRYMGYFRK
jgi:hypothetical protein